MQALLPSGGLDTRAVHTADELAAALAGETMDIAYLYCHGAYHKPTPITQPCTVLQFADTFVSPVDISNWRRRGGPWPHPHWAIRKPLVVLNGCHTAEFTTATLSNFVDAFVNRAGAAGVIGMEIAVEQGVAGWAAEQLIRVLLPGDQTVGEAIRQVRWQLFNRGNTIGLALALHAIAELQLRPSSLLTTLKEPQ